MSFPVFLSASNGKRYITKKNIPKIKEKKANHKNTWSVNYSLVMPILTREVTIHLDPGTTANASLDLSNLGFLLGTFPSAPGILFYAIQYSVAVETVCLIFSETRFVAAIAFNTLTYTVTDCHGHGCLHFRSSSTYLRISPDGLTIVS